MYNIFMKNIIFKLVHLYQYHNLSVITQVGGEFLLGYNKDS